MSYDAWAFKQNGAGPSRPTDDDAEIRCGEDGGRRVGCHASRAEKCAVVGLAVNRRSFTYDERSATGFADRSTSKRCYKSTRALFRSQPLNLVNTKKTSHRIFGHMHEVLNEVFLQFFLHGWAVNREKNLMSLFNS